MFLLYHVKLCQTSKIQKIKYDCVIAIPEVNNSEQFSRCVSLLTVHWYYLQICFSKGKISGLGESFGRIGKKEKRVPININRGGL